MIEIGNYRITADSYQVIVNEKRKSKDGKENWKQIAFFGNLEQAANDVLGRLERTLVQESNDIQELIKAVREAEKTVSDAVRGKEV